MKKMKFLFTLFCVLSLLFGEGRERLGKELNELLGLDWRWSGSCENEMLVRAKMTELLKLGGDYALKFLQNAKGKKPHIAVSDDGKFRAYSVFTGGGSMASFYNIYQFTDGKRNYVADFFDEYMKECDRGGECECLSWFSLGAPYVNKIYKVKDGLYLVYSLATASAKLAEVVVKAFRIETDGIKQAKIFVYDDGSIKSHYGVGFNYFSVVDGTDDIQEKWYNDKVVVYKNGVLKVLNAVYTDKYPDGKLTSQYESFRFDGEKFLIK